MKKEVGFCALCGTYGDLTYEHIPPKAAFNSAPAKMYTGTELLKKGSNQMPWDVQGLTYKSRQKGAGKFALCEGCNNKTGSWYGSAYQDMARRVSKALQHPEIETSQGLEIKDVYPLRFFKQIVSMFCSVNDYKALYKRPEHVPDKDQLSPLFQNLVASQEALYVASLLMNELRQFVLNRDAVGLDKNKFKVCMYLTRSSLLKLNGISASIHIEENTYDIISEITAAPFGFLLYFNPSATRDWTGVDITALSDVGYDEKCNIEFPVRILEMNTYFPGDYRSKEEIEKAITKSAQEQD